MSFLDLIFPKYCVSCRKKGKCLCLDCRSKITRLGQICPECGRSSFFGMTHPGCFKKNSLSGVYSFFAYEEPIRTAIHKLKYRLVTELWEELWQVVLGEILGKRENFRAIENWIEGRKPRVMPIPLFWYKENFRGFNQALLFASKLGDLWGLRVEEGLVRKKNNLSQTKLNYKQRQENIKGVFEPAFSSVSKFALLVDDVWTTGATLKEAGRILKKAGAEEVWGITLAR